MGDDPVLLCDGKTMKKVMIGGLLALGLLLGTGGAAIAGEYDGRGNPVPGGDQGASACSYSGRDVPDDVEGNPPGFDDDVFTGGHVQSYGILVKAGAKGFAPSPGDACRGNAEHVD